MDSKNKDVAIQNIPADESWFETTETGGLILGTAVKTGGLRPVELSLPARCALAFNQHCCERQFGKVYITLPVPDKTTTTMTVATEQIYRKAPEIFWAPEAWDPNEVDWWKSANPRDRLCRASALAGWISNHTVILPFAVELEVRRRSRPQINALTSQEVTVFLAPQPFVGMTADMRKVCQLKKITNEKDAVIAVVYDGVGWDDFAKWRVEGMPGVLSALESLWRAGEAVVLFGTIRKALIDVEAEVSSLRDESSNVQATENTQASSDAAGENAVGRA